MSSPNQSNPSTNGTASAGSGSGSNGGNNSNGNRNNGNNNGNGRSRGKGNNSNGTTTDVIDAKFRNDDPSLGPMSGKYFDCTSVSAGPVRFTTTKDHLIQYIGSNGKYNVGTATLVTMIKDMTLPKSGNAAASIKMPTKSVPDPNDPNAMITVPKQNDELTFIEQEDIKIQLKGLHDEDRSIQRSIGQLFHFIYTRCTDRLQERVKAHKMFPTAEQEANPVALLKIIREITHQIETNTYLPLAIANQNRSIYSLKQGPKESIASYHTTFKSLVDAAHTLGSGFHVHQGIRKEVMEEMGLVDYDALTTDKKGKVTAECKQRYLAILFLQGADPSRFGTVLRDLNKDYSKNIKTFPKSVQDAIDFLTKWEDDEKAAKRKEDSRRQQQQKKQQHQQNSNGSGTPSTSTGTLNSTANTTVTFAGMEDPTATTAIPGANKTKSSKKKGTLKGTTNMALSHPDTDETNDTIDCNAVFCTSHRADDSVPTLFGKIFAHVKSSIPRTLIILDSGSTVDVFCNVKLLTHIHRVPVKMIIDSQGGQSVTDQIGFLVGYGWVWFDPNGVANILSMSRAESKGFNINYAKPSFFVQHPQTGAARVFSCNADGLYVNDIFASPPCSTPTAEKTSTTDSCKSLPPSSATPPVVPSTALVTTVASKSVKYSEAERRSAEKARRLQTSIGFPSSPDLMEYLDNNIIKHCTLTRKDVAAAEDIWGPSEDILAGKTVQRPAPKNVLSVSPVPPAILARYGDVTLCVDILYVNGIPFLHTISEHIKFRTIELLDSRTTASLLSAITTAIKTYTNRGFKVVLVKGDPEFECLLGQMPPGTTITCCAEDEHVPAVERSIRTVKERVRCTMHSLPFEYWPRALTVNLLYAIIFWLNVFPPKGGVHSTLSPCAILTGFALDYTKHCLLPFGTYVHTHEKTDNTMTPRTIPAIAIRPHPNGNGSFLFLSLKTGRILHRGSRSYTELPMPQTVIDTINAFGQSVQAPGIVFGDAADDVPYEPTSAEPQADVPLPSNLDPITPTELEDLANDLADNTHSELDQDSEEPWHIVGGANAGVTTDPNPRPDPTAGNRHAPNRYAILQPNDTDDDATDAIEAHQPNDTDDDATDAIEAHQPNDTDDDASDTTEDDKSDEESDANDDESIMHDEDNSLSQNRSVDDDSSENRSVDDDTSYTPDSGHDIVVTNVRDPSLAPRVQRELQRLSHHTGPNAGSVVTTSAPLTDAGMTTRSGRTLTTIGHRNTDTDDDHPSPMTIDPKAWEHTYGEAFGLCLTQHGANKGLKLWGNRAVQAIQKEMEQVDAMDVIEPIKPSDLSPTERERVLEYLMFLKEKRDGSIKGRGCADGRKQRAWTSKYDSSSPTAFLESLFLTASIDAKEGRNVATVDVPGAFLQTNQDENETIHVRLQGEMARLLGKINPDKYEPFTVHEHGKPVLYAKLKKCLYGTLRAALQFWEHLSSLLSKWGYTPNDYDPCVMNKEVNGTQCTVLWHVDDLKISHMEQSVIEDLVAKLNDEFGSHLPMKAQYGDIHEYLGMTLDFSDPGKVKIIMDDFVAKLLAELPDHDYWLGTATTPAAAKLFETRNTAPKLSTSEADHFHSTTAKLLFLGMRARPDIMTAVSFLTTRVSSPDIDDRNKLRRVIQYIRSTRDLHLTLEPTDLLVYKWHIDASFAVHPNMRSHTGATATCGKGSFVSVSTKQKINTRSSTTAELVGVDDVMGRILWTINFLKCQGYDAKHTIGQDNQSAILLENNGRLSSSKRTRHMNIRYFFITDCIAKGLVDIEYVPTTDMLADFFTKPLGGYLFKKLRAMIMNLPLPAPSANETEPIGSTDSSQECVGPKDRPSAADHKQPPSPHSVIKA